MNRNLRILSLLAALPVLHACSGSEPATQQTVPAVRPPVVRPAAAEQTAVPEKPVRKRYVYRGDSRRDPFIPLAMDGPAGIGESDEVIVPALTTLELKGIFDDGRQRMALLRSGASSYILRGSRLFDGRQRLVTGVTGVIREDSVTVIGPDKSTRELRIREN